FEERSRTMDERGRAKNEDVTPQAPKPAETVGAVPKAPQEVLTTMKKDGHRRYIHPTTSPGRWLNARQVVGYLLIVLFCLLPVFHVKRKPAVLPDLVEMEFTFFGMSFHATHTIVLMTGGIVTLVA